MLETEKDSGRRLMSEWMCLRERERERGRMILRALYDSLMMEDLLRKFHRFSRRRERDNEREKKFRTELEISRTRKSKIFTILRIKTLLVKK